MEKLLDLGLTGRGVLFDLSQVDNQSRHRQHCFATLDALFCFFFGFAHGWLTTPHST